MNRRVQPQLFLTTNGSMVGTMTKLVIPFEGHHCTDGSIQTFDVYTDPHVGCLTAQLG
jgi:hypothetical protein